MNRAALLAGAGGILIGGGAMVIAGGAIGIAGNTVLGRLADQYGRRLLGLLVLAVYPFLAAAAFRFESIYLIVPAWVALVFATTGANTLIRALAVELFPTESRSTAAGSLSLFETVGAALGLYLLTAFTPVGHSIALAVHHPDASSSGARKASLPRNPEAASESA